MQIITKDRDLDKMINYVNWFDIISKSKGNKITNT